MYDRVSRYFIAETRMKHKGSVIIRTVIFTYESGINLSGTILNPRGDLHHRLLFVKSEIFWRSSNCFFQTGRKCAKEKNHVGHVYDVYDDCNRGIIVNSNRSLVVSRDIVVRCTD